MHPVTGMFKMLSHMDEGTRQLDQALIKGRRPSLPAFFQPKGLEDIVGFVVILTVEMVKICGVPYIPSPWVDPIP
jgi:hypothetical protein